MENSDISKSVKEVTLIVNASPKSWPGETISYEQIVVLSVGRFLPISSTIYTVTFSAGPEKRKTGSMTAGDSVHVKDKMVFNVTATSQS